MKTTTNLKKITYAICPECGGDGKETCTNPDHGLIDVLGFHDIGRIGCPCCGHDPNHKVKNGGKCEVCNGTGKVTMEKSGTELDVIIKELLESFDKAEKASKKFAATIENIFNESLEGFCIYQVAKVTKLLLKLDKASLVTRWYWKRRLNREYARLIDITKVVEEYKSN